MEGSTVSVLDSGPAGGVMVPKRRAAKGYTNFYLVRGYGGPPTICPGC